MVGHLFASVWSDLSDLGRFWADTIGAMFLAPGSTLALDWLLCTALLAAFLAIPRGRRTLPRLAVWRRALFPRRLYRSKSGRADIAWLAFGLFGYGLLFGWMIVSSRSLGDAVLHTLTSVLGPTHASALPPVVEGAILTALLFLAYEFAYWLDHFLSHKLPILWQFHRVHHGAESLSLLTNFRVHPLDTLVFVNIAAMVVGVTQGIAGYALGPAAHGWEVGGTNVLVLGAAVSLTHLQHSHLWITFGPRWGRWLLSPAHHQIHHSDDQRHYDRNFGSSLAIWDRLFGTLHVPAAKREPLRFGLGAAQPEPHGLRAALVTPFAGAAALVIGKPVDGNPAADTVPGLSAEPLLRG